MRVKYLEANNQKHMFLIGFFFITRFGINHE